MVGRTSRARKRSKSMREQAARQTKFTLVVIAQEGKCWFCGDAMGADCTKEHLHPQCFGGTDTKPRGNLTAAHRDCNSAAGHLPIADKYRLREIGHAEGAAAMIIVAKQLRRADVRMGFRAKDQETVARQFAIDEWLKFNKEKRRA